ncbi:MAG: exodeoxyribonuclease VII small subunit [Syntrophales bacterium]|nr:exodeoxyribonuclease VII small subunit [Syntrophales bacterium]
MAKDKFEDALSRLEEIVHRMEEGDLSLDESLKAFEEGIKLVRICSKKLEDAQRRIEILTKNEQGDTTVNPFSGEEDGNGQ